MRQVQMLAQFIARLIFKKDTIEYTIFDEDNLTATDFLYREIDELRRLGKICEAEDLLHERIQSDNEKHLELAVDFYLKINELNDEELEVANFSREEIHEGVEEIIRIFGLPKVDLD